MANSPLFGRWQSISSIRGAVIALGMERMRETLVDTLRAHHSLSNMVFVPELVGIVLLSDRFCRARGIGYGIDEQVWFDSPRDPSLDQVRGYCPLLASVNFNRLSAELDTYIKDVRNLVRVIYHLN